MATEEDFETSAEIDAFLQTHCDPRHMAYGNHQGASAPDRLGILSGSMTAVSRLSNPGVNGATSMDDYSRHQPSPGDDVVAVNGRLLAAAPDLFQAVQDLRVLVERIASDEEMAGEAGTILFRAEEAVRKATVPPDGVICHGEAI